MNQQQKLKYCVTYKLTMKTGIIWKQYWSINHNDSSKSLLIRLGLSHCYIREEPRWLWCLILQMTHDSNIPLYIFSSNFWIWFHVHAISPSPLTRYIQRHRKLQNFLIFFLNCQNTKKMYIRTFAQHLLLTSQETNW